jgi:site-specific recombinase XerD
MKAQKNTLVRLTLSQAIQGFFLTQQARGLSTHTIQDYTNTLTRFRKHLEKDYLMEQITARHIEIFLASQTHLKKKTLLNYHTGLAALWTWAVKEKIAAEHVPHEVPPPKPEEIQVVPYNEAEVRAMLNSLHRSRKYRRPGKKFSDHALTFPERNRAMILLLVDTGLRAEELCNIKLHELDKRNQRIRIFGKGAKERFVSFSSRTHQALWRYLTTRPEIQPNDPLFVTENGRAFKRGRLLKMLKNIGNRSGVTGVTIHRFRHTFAIQYLRNHGDPYTLQKMLGHSDLKMVKRYLAIAQADVEAAHRLASPVDNWAL